MSNPTVALEGSYKCVYMFDGERRETPIAAIVLVKEGFWINEHGQFTMEVLIAKYWIPPSAILFAEKILPLPKL